MQFTDTNDAAIWTSRKKKGYSCSRQCVMRIRKGFFSKHWTIINLIGRRIRIGPCMNGRTDAREQSFPSDTARLPFMRNGLGGFFKKFARAYREGFRPSHDRLCKMHNDNGISFSFRNAVWCASSETSLDLGFNTMRSRFTILLDRGDNCFRSQHRKCWITQILLPWMPLIKGKRGEYGDRSTKIILRCSNFVFP